MTRVIEAYIAAKADLGIALGTTEDLLHLHAGLLIFFFSALLFRKHMRSMIPIALVYLFALGNELIDAFGGSANVTNWEPIIDVANTVAWPTLVFLLARRSYAGGLE